MSRFKDALNVMGQARTNQIADDQIPTPPPKTLAQTSLRPPGKRRDPQYTQCNSYIPRTLYKRTRLALMEDEIELGELLEQLLTKWLDSREKQD